MLVISSLLYFYGCAKKEEPIIYIFNYVTGEEKTSRLEQSKLISTKEHKDTLKIEKKTDSSAPQSKDFEASLIEKQSIKQIKKTIHSRHLDFNFDKIQDFIVFFNIESDIDTISYFSIYLNEDNSLRNTFDYRFDEHLTKIHSVSTYSDSTIRIKFQNRKSKKTNEIRFIFKPLNNFLLID